MDLPATIIGDFEPECLVVIGRNRGAPPWVPPAAFANARVVRIEDRDRAVAYPEQLALDLDSVGQFDVVVDVEHSIGELGATMQIFEITFGRLDPDGIYIVHGSLPSVTVLDLMLASVASPAVVDSVCLDPDYVVVRRGPAASRPKVRLGDLRSDPFGVASR
jgi:hypothetical protein